MKASGTVQGKKNAQRCSNSSAKRLEQLVIAIEKSSP
jgi:hypothetical protein